jgi:hypothetical protein
MSPAVATQLHSLSLSLSLSLIWQERLQSGEGLPDYIKDMPVYYAGPAKTPDGMASGSFGPTTAGRMDSYVEPFQAAGGSMVMLAKGNRSSAVTRACQKHGECRRAAASGRMEQSEGDRSWVGMTVTPCVAGELKGLGKGVRSKRARRAREL